MFSCKKSDIAAAKNANTISVEKFLTAPPNTDPAVLKVIEKLKNMQAQNPFLEKFIEQNGYAYWDKAYVQAPPVNINTSNDTAYATIPMAVINTEIVNSLLVAKIANNFVSVEQTKDVNYGILPLEKDATSTQLSKEDFAQIFFKFSKDVFNATDFEIKDSLMFQTDSSLTASTYSSAEQKESIYVSLRGTNPGAPTNTGVFTCISARVYLTYYAFNYYPSLNTTFFDLFQVSQNIFTCSLNMDLPDRFPLLTQIDPPSPTTGPSAPPIPNHPWVLAGFALENKNPVENNENDENTNVIGGYNTTVYPTYTPGNFPTVTNVIPVNSAGVNYDFKGWGSNGLARYSMNYTKAQIAEKNQQISNYGDAGQTYNIYDETTGVNPTATNEAISYIIGALQAGIPVVVGVDCRPGTTVPSNDNTTDHFVTIVGMGNDGVSNFFRFYDCSTYSISQGTRSSNKLRYLLSGRLEGQSPTLFANTSGFTPYKITQVRRSKPL